jgi:hypothetical protein
MTVRWLVYLGAGLLAAASPVCACVGDCDLDGRVSVGEVVLGSGTRERRVRRQQRANGADLHARFDEAALSRSKVKTLVTCQDRTETFPQMSQMAADGKERRGRVAFSTHSR